MISPYVILSLLLLDHSWHSVSRYFKPPSRGHATFKRHYYILDSSLSLPTDEHDVIKNTIGQFLEIFQMHHLSQCFRVWKIGITNII